jgi:AcrR family transcriptional regulator
MVEAMVKTAAANDSARTLELPRARGRPRAADVAELEARLVRVARQTFIAHGYGASSMNEIARAARVSKTTLYARFPSKADLFRAIIDDQIRGGSLHILHAFSPAARTLEAKLREYGEHTLRASLKGDMLHLNRLIYGEAPRFPEIAETAWRRGRIGVGQVAELIREHAEADGIACRDPEAVAEAYISMLRGWYQDAILRNRPATAAEVAAAVDSFLRILLAGRAGW